MSIAIQSIEDVDLKIPRFEGWEERLPMTQLYPLLVHAVFFGESYLTRVKEIIKHFS